MTPLYYASLARLKRTVESLLKEEVNVDAFRGDWGSALHAASAGGYPQVVQLLLDKKANVDLGGVRGWTPLWCAVIELPLQKSEHEAVVKVLTANGADTEVKGKYSGQTLLTWVAEKGH